MWQRARSVMSPFVSALVAKPGVQAVSILSSAADFTACKTRFDEHSDFDISLVLDIPMYSEEWRPRVVDTYRLLSDRIPSWVPNFMFHVPVSWGEMEVNVHQLIFDYENDPRTAWDGEKCDVYANKREIVFDRDGRFSELVSRKVQSGQEHLTNETARLSNRITWDIREMPLRQAKRHGAAAGHYVLNHAVEEVLDYAFAQSGKFISNKKWKFVDLAAILDQWSGNSKALLEAALRCDPTSAEDLERRIAALEELCNRMPGLATSGDEVVEKRRRFQSCIEVSPSTLADQICAEYEPGTKEMVRNVINYTLSANRAELDTAIGAVDSITQWTDAVTAIRRSGNKTETSNGN